MIAFNCPTCEKHFKLSDRFAGRSLFCSGCKMEFVVPRLEEESSPVPISAETKDVSPSTWEELYKIPEASAVDVRFPGSHIEFDCSNCHKHYVFTRRFAGRIMLCSGCKSELSVPEPIEGEPVEAGPLPPVPPPTYSAPPPTPPPPPPSGGFTSSSGFDGFDLKLPNSEDDAYRFENAMAVRTEDDSAILAYVYQEKHAESTETPVSEPSSMPMPETLPGKRRNVKFWLGIFGVLVLIGGVCVYLALTLESTPPDTRPALLEQIAKRKTDVGTEAGARDAEARRLRTEFLESWNTTGAMIDNYLVTLGEFLLQQETLKKTPMSQRRENEVALAATKNRLNEFRGQIQIARERAEKLESDALQTEAESKRLAAENRFFAEEETKLADRIRKAPTERSAVSFPSFVPDRVVAEESARFDNDWTENDFFRFDFSGDMKEDFFAAPDGSRRGFGDKSLRITLGGKQPDSVVFPRDGRARQNLGSCNSFVFSVRFPELGDRIAVGVDSDAGKIGEYRIRFVNSSGHVDFTTTSPRYCEALYYDARSNFTTVEFPLSGDEFWQRTNHFDLAKLDRNDDEIDSLLSAGETGAVPSETVPEVANENVSGTFFSRIDRIEIRFTPLSFPTTLWLDGISVSEKEVSHPYDLLRAESLQSDLRVKDTELRRKRLAAATETPQEETDTANGASETMETSENNADEESPPEFAGSEEQRVRKAFLWILREGGGRLQARSNGQRYSFGAKSPEPVSFEHFIVEEVDLSRSRNVTDEKLDLLSVLKELRKLDLSYTGLKDESLIRLATLTNLESLNLGGNDLTFAGMPSIQTLKNLRDLNLDGIRTSVDGIDALGDLTGLRSLSLARSLTDSGDLIYLLTLGELETLDLSGTKIGDRALTNLRAFPTLQTLNLSKTRITDAGMAQLDRLQKLRRLDLNETGLGNACLKSIGRLESLEEVSVLKTKITRDGVRQSLGSAWVARFKFSE